MYAEDLVQPRRPTNADQRAAVLDAISHCLSLLRREPQVSGQQHKRIRFTSERWQVLRSAFDEEQPRALENLLDVDPAASARIHVPRSWLSDHGDK